jgi:hypothetical protein
MRKSERRLIKKLTLSRETVRTLTRGDLTKVAGGLADSHETCVTKVPLVPPASVAPCG